MIGWDVELTYRGALRAYAVGRERHEWNRARGHRDGHNGDFTDEVGLALHVQGAGAELAVRDAYGGLTWEPVWDHLDRRRPDVGNLHVRSTRKLDAPRLRIWHDDPDEAPFVLVLALAPRRFRLAGWLRAGLGKDWKWHQDWGRRGFYIPECRTRPLWTCPVSDE